MLNLLQTLKDSLKESFKFGPGGIRTHDQGIMSPLRYRCATGPWHLLLNYHPRACVSVSFALALPSSPRKILNLSRRQSANRPVAYSIVIPTSVVCIQTANLVPLLRTTDTQNLWSIPTNKV